MSSASIDGIGYVPRARTLRRRARANRRGERHSRGAVVAGQQAYLVGPQAVDERMHQRDVCRPAATPLLQQLQLLREVSGVLTSEPRVGGILRRGRGPVAFDASRHPGPAGPAIVQAGVDPFTPPMPPKVPAKQTRPR
jgi:hypothetical protein